jgi:ATP-binding cassette, subfamily F, member 3
VNYLGTFVVISHDRWFLSQVANKIWYIEDHILKEYPGNYEEFQYFLKSKQAPPPPKKMAKVETPVTNGKVIEKSSPKNVEKKSEPSIQKPAEKKEAPKPDYFQDKDRKKTLRRLEDKVKSCEEKIEAQEKKRQELLTEMALPEVVTDHQKIAALQEQLKRTETEIAMVTMEWEQAFEQLESAR